MLTSLGSHASFDLTVHAKGDVEIEGHHTIEDTAIVLGQALGQALGDKKGIRRFGDAFIPMDETLAHAAVDVSGRPYCVHTGEPESHAALHDRRLRGALPHRDQPARVRIAGHQRPHRAARAHAVRPRPAPHHRGAVQGRRPGAAAGRRARPAVSAACRPPKARCDNEIRRRPRLRLGQPAVGPARAGAGRRRRRGDRRHRRGRSTPTASWCPASARSRRA